MKYEVILTRCAAKMLAEIKDIRVQVKIAARMDGLAYDPVKQGKELSGELFQYRSTRAAGQRYRIVYQVKQHRVFIVAIGLRREGSKKDVYQLAQKFLRQGLLANHL